MRVLIWISLVANHMDYIFLFCLAAIDYIFLVKDLFKLGGLIFN